MNRIRKGYWYKVISIYLALNIILPLSDSYNLYALTSGPSQPEFNSFTPISTSDMVNLSTGDFNYNIPLMDVGGYPINIAYDSGITMDQEASWVGLGWNLNIGQINRQVRGLPDDFNGDVMTYENNMKDNKTYGLNVNVQPAVFGNDFPVDIGIGLGVEINNYEGISFKPSVGVTYKLSDNVNIGLDVSSSTANGASVSPNVKLSKQKHFKDASFISNTTNVGVSLNSRQGLNSLNISSTFQAGKTKVNTETNKLEDTGGGLGFAGSISFIDNTFTPMKRVAQENESLTFNAGLGSAFIGAELDLRIRGYGSKQSIQDSEKFKEEKAYGYEFTEQSVNGILDFNREKDRNINKNTTILPVTNYTYDIYSIQGQGIGGMFRPFRSQVSHVYDKKVTDNGSGASFGAEIAGGLYFHGGVDVKFTKSTSSTGLWERGNFVKSRFDESNNTADERLDYEPVYFRTIGELDVDREKELLNTRLGGASPVKIGIGGSRYNRSASKEYLVKETNPEDGQISYASNPISSKIKRSERQLRNQSIQKITKKEAIDQQDDFIAINQNAEPHHTAGIKVLKENGSTYVYGETAYNKNKVETTFTIDKSRQGDCATGLISYLPGLENTAANNSGIDEFYNKVITPDYAHTYLLSSVLSSDYEDLTGDGPSDDDLGAYTKFTYTTKETDYKWRVPYAENMASFNEGLKSLNNDQKGNYIYGEKELKYIDKIETKTHIAVFTLTERDDARGVKGENGGGDSSSGHMYKIDKISLYSRPDYKNNGTNAIPLKEVHFEYDYSLAQGVPNNLNGEGKLTLTKLYFTYQNSKMGKYTPYQFHYNQYDEDGELIQNNPLNPNYNLKGYDIWGNYKENLADGCRIDDTITTAEFPFVEQDKEKADINVAAWSLTSIDLPSGGKLELEYESDDYQYVQDRQAMQMYKVVGAGFNDSHTNINNDILYNGSTHIKYLYVKIDDIYNSGQEELFKQNYIGDQIDKPIYFRFLLNMVKNTSWQYDYVSGYFTIDENSPFEIIKDSGSTYAAIPIDTLNKEGGWVGSSDQVNPISKAGWYFGRKYLNRVVYSLGGDAVSDDFESTVRALVGSLRGVIEIFQGPNGRLQNERKCARVFKPDKSWIRLLNPDKRKLGGGARVKKLVMHDNWDEMTGKLDNPLYKQQYGQIYSYVKEDGTSSGVATFEPNMSKENPFVEPFYDKEGDSKRDKLIAPKEDNFIEKPIGESFFPSPIVTYSRVEVKNLERNDGENVVKNHATGSVVNEFYTSYDFPTITDYTDIDPKYDKTGTLGSLLRINVRNHLTMSQGFVIRTNDMNGKQKSQWIYAEGQDKPISGVEYKYNIDENNQLNNELVTIKSDGKIEKNIIGVHYDAVNDFRESYSKFESRGANVNVNVFPLLIFPGVIVTVIPEYANHENILRMATTTKVIHSTGILKEKIAYDLGSKVSTENLAWDAETGQVLLTKTINEYDDAYYNLSYPSHWYYDSMSEASKNIGVEATLKSIDDKPYFSLDREGASPSDYLTLGDEIFTYARNNNNRLKPNEKLWVVDFQDVVVPIDQGGGDGTATYRLVEVECFIEDGQGNAQGGSEFFPAIQLVGHSELPNGFYQGSFSEQQFREGQLDCSVTLSENDFIGTGLSAFEDLTDCPSNAEKTAYNGPSYSECNPVVNPTPRTSAIYRTVYSFCEDGSRLESERVVIVISGHPDLADGLYNVVGATVQQFADNELPLSLNLTSADFLATTADQYAVLYPLSCTANSAMLRRTYFGTNPSINGGSPAIETKIVKGVMLMDRNGKITNNCNDSSFIEELFIKVVRSGYRNLQMANMASVTSMVNPIDMDNDGSLEVSLSNIYNNVGAEYRIVNSSAIEYSDIWKTQCERIFKDFNESTYFDADGSFRNPTRLWFNPYVYNVKGDWRAQKSYAYLTGRKASDNASPRNDGFYIDFNPFYTYGGGEWQKDQSEWTAASEVTQYSPYGVEVENKDALDRYSSAQYGYNYTLPTAVASNSKYREMGYDGFEDYTYESIGSGLANTHFGYHDNLNNYNNKISINTRHSHTGKSSIAVASNSSVTLDKQLFDCLDPEGGCPPPDSDTVISIPVQETAASGCVADQENIDCQSENIFDLSSIPNGEILRLTFSATTATQGSASAGFALLKNGLQVDIAGAGNSFTVEVTNSDTLVLYLEAGAFGTPGSNNGGSSFIDIDLNEAVLLSGGATINVSETNFSISASCC